MEKLVDDLLIVENRGALAELTLNRPRALNALNDAMRAAVLAALPGLAGDSETYAMAIRSNSARAFCAGGDVRELTEMARRDPKLAARSLGQEYFMNWSLECFTKPTVSLIDGMVMGSGVGLMLYGTHRVAGAGFTFAMPETAIGLFPDVGVCTALSKMPGHMGRYIGLTGRSIGRTAAYRLGIVTHCVDAGQFEEITAGLADADPVDPILDGLHRDPEADAIDDGLAGRDALIEDVFAGASVADIMAALARRAGSGGADAAWCEEVLGDLRKRAPLSLLVTLRHLDACRSWGLRDVLIGDYRLAVRFLAGADLHEGVRAVLIDKDGQPKWRHAAIEDVKSEEIDQYFTTLGDDELTLPEREEMQEIRA